MDNSATIDLVRQALVLVVVLGLPVLLTGLAIGLLVSVIQALTSVQEHTLSFVPRILGMLLALVVAGPWMVQRLIEFSRQAFGELP
jgi:flagellar biosynthetic protein FliQ